MSYVGYIRVSSIDQNIARQEEAFSNLDFTVEKIYIDKFSGKTFKRPQFEEMNKFIRSGDTLVVKSIDRLSRSQSDLVNYINELYAREIGFYCIEMPIFNFKASKKLDHISKFLMDIMSSLSEMERAIIRQRQREGIEAAKLAGRHIGRPKSALENPLYIKVDELVAFGLPKTVACKKLKVNLSSYYRYLDLKKKESIETMDTKLASEI